MAYLMAAIILGVLLGLWLLPDQTGGGELPSYRPDDDSIPVRLDDGDD